jgi:hypothetical protein
MSCGGAPEIELYQNVGIGLEPVGKLAGRCEDGPLKGLWFVSEYRKVVAEDVRCVGRAGRLDSSPMRDMQRKIFAAKAPVICRVVRMCVGTSETNELTSQPGFLVNQE